MSEGLKGKKKAQRLCTAKGKSILPAALRFVMGETFAA